MIDRREREKERNKGSRRERECASVKIVRVRSRVNISIVRVLCNVINSRLSNVSDVLSMANLESFQRVTSPREVVTQ